MTNLSFAWQTTSNKVDVGGKFSSIKLYTRNKNRDNSLLALMAIESVQWVTLRVFRNEWKNNRIAFSARFQWGFRKHFLAPIFFPPLWANRFCRQFLLFNYSMVKRNSFSELLCVGAYGTIIRGCIHKMNLSMKFFLFRWELKAVEMTKGLSRKTSSRHFFFWSENSLPSFPPHIINQYHETIVGFLFISLTRDSVLGGEFSAEFGKILFEFLLCCFPEVLLANEKFSAVSCGKSFCPTHTSNPGVSYPNLCCSVCCYFGLTRMKVGEEHL